MTAAEFDVAVIGAGPGGAACALAAARARLRVLLIEPQGNVFDKPCGEGIMPSGVAALAALGLSTSSMEAFAFRRLRFVHEGRNALDIELDSEACSLARPSLLSELSRAIEEHPGVSRAHAHAHARRHAGGFEVRMTAHRNASRDTIATAAALVGADGIGGQTAAWLRGERRVRRSRRIGIRARFEAAEALDFVEVHIGRGVDVYLTPLPSGVVNVAVLFEREPACVRGAEALCAWALAFHPRARTRLGREITPAVARALDRTYPQTVAQGDVFLVGDAAGAVDPILGCGVSLALESGIAAAHAVQARKRGALAEEVARRYRDEWRRMFASRMRLASALRRLSSHPRAASAILGVLRRSPSLRRHLCRVVGGESSPISRPSPERGVACTT